MSDNEQREPTLYDKMKDAGFVIGNHQSDLYVKNTAESRQILQDAGKNLNSLERFETEEEGHHIECLDVPFEYQPYWDAKELARKRHEASNDHGGPGGP